MTVKDKYQKHKKKLIILLGFFTVVELFLVPFNASSTELAKLPIFATLLLFSESLFIIGLLLIALSVEHDLGPNPLKWRRHFKTLIKHIPNDKKFWIGFWINLVGALSTGLIVLFGIIFVLPIESWGIIWLPITDIAITILLRATILELRRESLKSTDNFPD